MDPSLRDPSVRVLIPVIFLAEIFLSGILLFGILLSGIFLSVNLYHYIISLSKIHKKLRQDNRYALPQCLIQIIRSICQNILSR